MTSAYIRKLQRDMEAINGAAGPQSPDLRQRVVAWFSSQPDVSRNRRYAMAELEQVMGVSSRLLSAVLTDLGWTRGRKWSSTGPNPRYWVPPPD